MVSLGRPLCSVCAQVFRPGTPRHEDKWVQPEGQSFEGFQQAIAEGCYICTEIQKKDLGYAVARKTWTPEQWQPLRYRWQTGYIGERGSLNVQSRDANAELSHDCFWLFRPDGEPRMTGSGRPSLTGNSTFNLGDGAVPAPRRQHVVRLDSGYGQRLV